jgi:hypothetical protein
MVYFDYGKHGGYGGYEGYEGFWQRLTFGVLVKDRP